MHAEYIYEISISAGLPLQGKECTPVVEVVLFCYGKENNYYQ